MQMIKTRGLTKWYSAGVIKTFVLRDIDLDVNEGEFLTTPAEYHFVKPRVLIICIGFSFAPDRQRHQQSPILLQN